MDKYQYDYNEIWKSVYGDIQEIGPTHRHIRRLCRKLLESLDYESILDVGCGPGDNIPLLCGKKNIKLLAGIDISNQILDVTRQRYTNSEFFALDIEKQHLNTKYDLVSCSLVMEHVVDDVSVLKNLYAMTGKYLLIVTVQGDYEKFIKWEKLMGHVRNYNEGELVAKLERVGFKIIKKIEWGYPFYSPLGRMFQNLDPKQGTGKINSITKLIANVLYLLYFLNSSHRGDMIIILAGV